MILGIGDASNPNDLWIAAKRGLFGSISTVRESLLAARVAPQLPLDLLPKVQVELDQVDSSSLQNISVCGPVFWLFCQAVLASQQGAQTNNRAAAMPSDTSSGGHEARAAGLKAVLAALQL